MTSAAVYQVLLCSNAVVTAGIKLVRCDITVITRGVSLSWQFPNIKRGRSLVKLYTPRYLLLCAYMAMIAVHREAGFDNSLFLPPFWASVAGSHSWRCGSEPER